MLKTKRYLAGSFLVCALVAAGAVAQSGSNDAMAANSGGSQLGATDKTFVQKAAQGGLAEVELGKLAADKGSSEDVKKFGQRMVDDHSKANDQLKQIATSKGLTVPDDLNSQDKATKAHLEKLSGAQFDRAYMNDMVKDHQQDIAEFNHEAKMGKDPDIKGFATETLPTLKDHLKSAHSVASQTGAPSNSSSAMK